MRKRNHRSRGLLPAAIHLIALACAGPALAQRGGGNSSLLEVGSSVPDLKAFKSNGEAIELAKAVKGKHAVIVFGCLT